MDRQIRVFLSRATGFSGAEKSAISRSVFETVDRARQDLASLRLFDLDHGPDAWTVAAGVPMYVAIFGRDTLTAGLEAALLGPEMMRGTLKELPRWQGRVIDDWRDEEPGRMLHEAHTGPRKVLNFNPRARYYGSTTPSHSYAVALSQAWHWTGDRKLVERLVEPALAAMAWSDSYGDPNGDGFYEYQTHSEQGLRNQGWKDSGDAIVDRKGEQVETPIAMCEEQGLVYASKRQLSEVLWWLGRKKQARRLFREARELKKRFHERFWMENRGALAMALGAGGRRIDTIASNMGHCLASGIVDSRFVSRVARRLMQPDLFTGWGIRTLSSDNPAYNPFSYHRGSVWPVEQAIFVRGFVRYGLHDLAERLSRAFFEAAALFEFQRLPEVFSGHPRDREHPFPAFYPRANSPQAWSSSAAFSVIQSLLGLHPYAPRRAVLIDPHLPPWLPELTLSGLRVGRAVVTIRFFRRGQSSHYEVLKKRGTLHVVRRPSPWSPTAGFAERFKDAPSSGPPGR
jgi:glycogen debranching enzyme